MFRVETQESWKSYRAVVLGLLLLSVTALAITLWELYDFAREQVIIEELIRTLPGEDTAPVEFLADELRWQFRLTILVVIHVVLTGIAIAFLARAYRTSQQSLRDIKAHAGDILSSMEQGVITTDLNGIVTSINRRGLEMLRPAGDCVGRSLREVSVHVPLDEFRNQWTIERSSGMTRDFTVKSDDHKTVLRTFCQTLNDVDGAEIGFVLQIRDVTARVLTEDRMLRMERYMGLGSLAAGLHHEIKNPLAALSLHVQLLEEQLERDNSCGEVQGMLRIIKTEMARVGRVLEGFRDFASLGRLNLHPVNIRELIQRQIDLILPQAASQSVDVNVQFSTNLPDDLPVDQVRLEQVLLNIFVNALEAMPDGGRVRIEATAEPAHVSIRISDTGPGVSDELREKILDPYFTTKSEGTGLGLALCDKIIRQHNGTLDIQPSDSGAVFLLVLPTSLQNQRTADERH